MQKWKGFIVMKGLWEEKENMAYCKGISTFYSMTFGLSKEDWLLIGEVMGWKNAPFKVLEVKK